MPKTSNLKQVHNNIRELKWLEEPIDIPEFSECLPNKKFYRGFQLGEWQVNIGDYVLVKTKSRAQLSQKNLCVARVDALFEDEDLHIPKYYSCEALVQWYTWPINIPQECFSDNIVFDFDLDVIEDVTIKYPVIKIDNMMGSCQVIYGVPSDVATEVMTTALEEHQVDGSVYLCKYRLIEHDNSLFLEPTTHIPNVKILSMEDADENPETDVIPPRKKRKVGRSSKKK